MRRLLQRVLITGKSEAPYRFSRFFKFTSTEIEIEDNVHKPASAPEITSLHIGSDATSIYVANSNVYQKSVLEPWQDLGQLAERINVAGDATHHHRALAKRESGEAAKDE